MKFNCVLYSIICRNQLFVRDRMFGHTTHLTKRLFLMKIEQLPYLNKLKMLRLLLSQRRECDCAESQENIIIELCL